MWPNSLAQEPWQALTGMQNMSMRGGRPQLSFSAEVTDIALSSRGEIRKETELKSMQLELVTK